MFSNCDSQYIVCHIVARNRYEHNHSLQNPAIWAWGVSRNCPLAMVIHIHPSKKVTQHNFDRLYFFHHGFIFIMLDIPGKPVYLPFDHWGVCRVSKCGAMSKMKSCNIDRIVWKVHGIVSVYTHTHCPSIVSKSSETKHHAEFQIVVQFWSIYFLTLRLI